MPHEKPIADLSAADLGLLATYESGADAVNEIRVTGELREVHHRRDETRIKLSDTTISIHGERREHESVTLDDLLSGGF